MHVTKADNVAMYTRVYEADDHLFIYRHSVHSSKIQPLVKMLETKHYSLWSSLDFPQQKELLPLLEQMKPEEQECLLRVMNQLKYVSLRSFKSYPCNDRLLNLLTRLQSIDRSNLLRLLESMGPQEQKKLISVVDNLNESEQVELLGILGELEALEQQILVNVLNPLCQYHINGESSCAT